MADARKRAGWNLRCPVPKWLLFLILCGEWFFTACVVYLLLTHAREQACTVCAGIAFALCMSLPWHFFPSFVREHSYVSNTCVPFYSTAHLLARLAFILVSITFYHFADIYTYVHYFLPLCRCLYLCPLLATTLQMFVLMSITLYHFADVYTYVHYFLPLCRWAALFAQWLGCSSI